MPGMGIGIGTWRSTVRSSSLVPQAIVPRENPVLGALSPVSWPASGPRAGWPHAIAQGRLGAGQVADVYAWEIIVNGQVIRRVNGNPFIDGAEVTLDLNLTPAEIQSVITPLSTEVSIQIRAIAVGSSAQSLVAFIPIVDERFTAPGFTATGFNVGE